MNPSSLGPIATRVVDGIEALDFDPDVACEGRNCSLPADVWATQTCRCAVVAVCQPCLDFDLAQTGPVECTSCLRPYPTVRDGLVILGPVKP